MAAVAVVFRAALGGMSLKSAHPWCAVCMYTAQANPHCRPVPCACRSAERSPHTTPQPLSSAQPQNTGLTC